MDLKKYLPHFAAVAVFVTITLIVFNPLFKSKIINQSDIIQYKGMSKELQDFRKSGRGEALWTNSTFGGMPAYQISTLYPGNWLGFFDKLLHLGLPHPSGYIFMGFFGFFIMLLCLQVNPWLALAGSLAYGFSSYFFIILDVGHNSKSNALGYIAPVLGGIILLMRRKYWLGFALSLLFMALELNANHIQITYYFFLMFALVLLAYCWQALKNKTMRSFLTGAGIFICACALAVLPNAASLMATYEYGQYTTRGPSELTINESLKPNTGNKTSGLDKDYATQYSYGIDETFTFLIPNFKGGISAPISYANKEALKNVDPELREQVGNEYAYFGKQSITAGPVYIGAIVILLAVLGLFIIEHPLKWPLLVATIFSVMLSWGKYFMGLTGFFMDYLPGYNKFRAVSMTLVVAELTIPLLAVLAAERLMKLSDQKATVKIPLLKNPQDLKKTLLISSLIVGGFCLLCYLVPTTMNEFVSAREEAEIADKFRQSGASPDQLSEILPRYIQAVTKARENIFKADVVRSLIFIVLAVCAALLLVTNRIKSTLFIAALSIFSVADLWPVAARYLNERSFVPKAQYDAPPAKSEADEQILADPSPEFRVVNLAMNPFQDATTSYYHKSIGGYHGAKLKKYDELISFHLLKELNQFTNGLNETQGNDSLVASLTGQLRVINMLNTKYMILPTRDNLIAFENPSTNGNAWFVKDLKTVVNADSEIVDLDRIDTKTQALIQQKNKPAGVSNKYDGQGSIVLNSYQPNYLKYESESGSKQFAVFSEIYYPKGWNAFIDGTAADHSCVDYVLRGMEIPAGRHSIEFKFEPKIYKTGNAVSLAGSVVLILGVAAGLYFGLKRREITF